MMSLASFFPGAVNWTSHASGNSNSLKGATYAGGQWIVVVTEGTVLRSTDGVNWTTAYTSSFYDLNDAAYGNGLFLVAGDGPENQNGSVFKSSDGVTWARASFYPGKNLRGVTFTNGLFFLAANDGIFLRRATRPRLSSTLSLAPTGTCAPPRGRTVFGSWPAITESSPLPPTRPSGPCGRRAPSTTCTRSRGWTAD